MKAVVGEGIIMTFLFDTSALLTHYFEETGHEVTSALLASAQGEVAVCAVSILEFEVKLREHQISTVELEKALSWYFESLLVVLDVDLETALQAGAIKRLTTPRLPNIDALIAGCAKYHGLTLVHRDKHLAAIPAASVKQIVLPQN